MERTLGKWSSEITHLNGHQPHFTIRAGENSEIPIAVIHNSPHDSANAAYIVRAVNCHERLVAVIVKRKECLQKQRAVLEKRNAREGCSVTILVDCCIEAVDGEMIGIDAALALAEGRADGDVS